MRGGVYVVYEQRGNVVARIDAAVLLFVRTRPLEREALDAIERLALGIDEFRKGPVGALAVIDGQAGLSDNTLLQRQRIFLRGFVRSEGDVYLAMVVLGDAVQSIAMRAVVRMFMIGRKTMHLDSDLDRAARWLGERVGRDPGEIAATARQLAARARATTA